MSKLRHRWGFIGIIMVIIIALLSTIMWYRSRVIVLRLGVFAGSNWDVPSGDSYKIIDEAIARFEKEHPNVKVEYQSGIQKEDYASWLANRFLKGEEPDVFVVLSEDFNTLSSLGALKDLSYLISHDENFTVDNYYASALNAGRYQNTQYALPYESNPTLMFVNKTLLKKEGIEMPKNDWTLSDFYSICQRVTKDTDGDGVIDQYGCYNYTWLDSVYSHGAQLFNDSGDEAFLNQDEIKDSISFVQKLNDLNNGHIITSSEFDKGKVAFAPMPFAQYRVYKPYPWRVKKYANFEWDCVKMPSLSFQKNTSEVSSMLMGISSRTMHQQEAWELLKILTYDEHTQRELFEYSQGISSLKSVIQSKDALSLFNRESMGDSQVDMSLLNEVMEHTVNHSQFRKYESALSLLDTRIEQFMRNEGESGDLDAFLINLQKEINKYLKE